MSKKYTGEVLPKNPSSWETATSHYQTGSIHALDSANSASEITVEQFLSLKVLWPKRKSTKDLGADKTASLFGSSAADINEARAQRQKDDPAWAAYLSALAATAGAGASGAKLYQSSQFSRQLGVYALVLQSQLETSKIQDSLNESNKLRFTPRRKPSGGHGDQGQEDPKGQAKPKPSNSPSRNSPHPSQGSKGSKGSKGSSGPADISPMTREIALDLPVGDEQIVNTAAINFLNALFIHDERRADWTLHRKQFKFSSNSVTFEARTDGHLQVHDSENSAAILEVKPRVREHELGFRIEMQESAQMALWILKEPNSYWAPRTGGNNHYRVLLSQDRHEIYVTIAEYTMNYIHYLQNKVNFEEADFLRMNMYGPFLTDDHGHMSWLGAILRKLLLYAATYRPGRQVSPSKFRTPSPAPNLPMDDGVGRQAPRQTEGEQRPKHQSSPLGSRTRESEKSSTSSGSGSEKITRKLFQKATLDDKPRSPSQSPQRGRASPAQDAGLGRSASPLRAIGSSSRTSSQASSTGEQSGQQGSKRAAEGGKRTRK